MLLRFRLRYIVLLKKLKIMKSDNNLSLEIIEIRIVYWHASSRNSKVFRIIFIRQFNWKASILHVNFTYKICHFKRNTWWKQWWHFSALFNSNSHIVRKVIKILLIKFRATALKDCEVAPVDVIYNQTRYLILVLHIYYINIITWSKSKCLRHYMKRWKYYQINLLNAEK